MKICSLYLVEIENLCPSGGWKVVISDACDRVLLPRIQAPSVYPESSPAEKLRWKRAQKN